MPEIVRAELYARMLLYCFIRLFDIAGGHADMPGLFREYHAARQYFEEKTVAVFVRYFFDHRAEAIAPPAPGIITIDNSRIHNIITLGVL